MKYKIATDKQFTRDVIEWDTVNWTRAIQFWENLMDSPEEGYTGLELGSRHGGLSLYFGINGYNMMATDLSNPKTLARPLHEKYKVTDFITYDEMYGGEIPYKDHFDLLTFKSVLGAICSNDRSDKLVPAIQNMYAALKPGGMLVFAENLRSTSIHGFFRKKFVRWGDRWYYLKLNEVLKALEPFSEVQYTTIGFVACFGRTEKQKRWLGMIDKLIEPFIPKRSRYILSVVAIK